MDLTHNPEFTTCEFYMACVAFYSVVHCSVSFCFTACCVLVVRACVSELLVPVLVSVLASVLA